MQISFNSNKIGYAKHPSNFKLDVKHRLWDREIRSVIGSRIFNISSIFFLNKISKAQAFFFSVVNPKFAPSQNLNNTHNTFNTKRNAGGSISAMHSPHAFMSMGYGTNPGVVPPTAAPSSAPSPATSSFMPMPPVPTTPNVTQQSGKHRQYSSTHRDTCRLQERVMLFQLFLLSRHPLDMNTNVRRRICPRFQLLGQLYYIYLLRYLLVILYRKNV
jgi:hypothetical protein